MVLILGNDTALSADAGVSAFRNTYHVFQGPLFGQKHPQTVGGILQRFRCLFTFNTWTGFVSVLLSSCSNRATCVHEV